MKILRNPAVQIGIGAIAGIAFGLIVGAWAGNLQIIGDLFIRLIQMSIVPLVMSSVISAIAGMTGAGTGKMAARTFGWILGFAVVAAVIAWALSALLSPGTGISFDGGVDESLEAQASEASGWQETILGFVSTNVVEAMSTANMVPIIVFSILFGAALRIHIAQTGNRDVLGIAERIQQVVLIMIRIVMRIAPLGVFALLAALTGEVGFAVVTTGLSYLGTTLLGVLVMTAIFVVVVTLRTGLSPLKLPAKLAEQTVVAVTTTSSAVTFPTVLKNTIEKVGVSPRVANFTCSIGLTMGSTGSVISYMTAIMFLAQSGNVTLGVGTIIMGMALTILINMGTITVPGGFPVVAMFLASSLDLPIEAIGLLIAVDWFAGILRTFINVNGDTFIAMLVATAEDAIDRDVYNGVAPAPALEPAERPGYESAAEHRE